MPTPAQLQAVRMLIETAPDAALRSLQTALAGVPDGPMASIRDMVSTEQSARGFKLEVFAPLAPLFAPRGDGLPAPCFPARALTGLWRELKARRPDLVAEAAAAADEWIRGEEPPPAQFDELCLEAGKLLRLDPRAVLRDGDEASAEQIAQYFDLAPIARTVVARLPDWLGKATDERVAALKLLFKDATAVAVDATPRLLEIILAHLPQAPAILRLVALLTDRAGDRYLASSELAPFGERLLADAEGRIGRIKSFDPLAGAASARAVALDVGAVCAVLAQMEQDVDLARDGPWGARVIAAKKSLATAVEGRLRDVEGLVAQALPLQTVRIAGRMTRPAPKIQSPPDDRAVERARALMTLLEETRASAGVGGYGALRNAVAEKLEERLNVYADEVLHQINAGDAPDRDIALAYVEIAAEFMGAAAGPKAAQIIRRRIAVAGENGASQDVA